MITNEIWSLFSALLSSTYFLSSTENISVGPTEEEVLDLLEQWNKSPKSDQHEEEIDSKEDEDSEVETPRFPIFRSSE